jgi:hypothetical protein
MTLFSFVLVHAIFSLALSSLSSLSLSLSVGDDNDEDDRLRRGHTRNRKSLTNRSQTKEVSAEVHRALTPQNTNS